MALIGQNQQTAFADPQAGQSPISAAVVRNNDNSLRAKLNAHDGDATIHIQTGLLANRPAAGTQYATYLDENGVIYRDTGAAWVEVGYARLGAASNTFTGNLAVNGGLAVDGNTALANTGVTGNVTVTGGVTADTVLANGVVASTATVAGAVTAASFAGDGAALTALNAAQLSGALPALNGASLTSLDATNIASGTLNVARLPTDLTTRTVTSLTAGPFTGTNAAFRLGSAASTSTPGDGGGANPSPGAPGNLPSGLDYYTVGGGVAAPLWLKFVDASGKACFIPYYREA
jgi:hypothetical protein